MNRRNPSGSPGGHHRPFATLEPLANKEFNPFVRRDVISLSIATEIPNSPLWSFDLQSSDLRGNNFCDRPLAKSTPSYCLANSMGPFVQPAPAIRIISSENGLSSGLTASTSQRTRRGNTCCRKQTSATNPHQSSDVDLHPVAQG